MATGGQTENWSDKYVEYQEQDHKKCQEPPNIRESSDELNADPELQDVDSLSCFSSLVKEVSTKAQDISSPGAVGGKADIPVQEIVRSPADRQVEGQVEKYINVKIPEDENTCNSFGCCSLSDGSLMVADFENKRLKRVDPSSSKVTKFCNTDEHPTDVCCIGPQEVVVAFSDSKKVQVYNTVSLTSTRTVDLGHVAERIAFHGGLLYCAMWDGTILNVHDVSSGRKLREISKDTDGQELFTDICGIAVNSSGDRLYVADGRGLVCVGADGTKIFCHSGEYLKLACAWGVTTDHQGHVFVSGENSCNVVKVTENGDKRGQRSLYSKGETKFRPLCLSYDVTRSSLYVGAQYSDQFLMIEWKYNLY